MTCTRVFLNLGLRTPKLAIGVQCPLPHSLFILEYLVKTRGESEIYRAPARRQALF